MPSQVRSEIGNHHQMEGSGWDRPVTPRAEIGLPRGVRLNRSDGHFVHHDRPQATIAQTTTAAVASSATTTIAMSSAVLVWGRNGLNPMNGTVNGRSRKSERARNPVHRDETPPEPDGYQINPVDAEFR